MSTTKTIISISAPSENGKTEVLRALANNFLLVYPSLTTRFPAPFKIPLQWDFRAVFTVSGKIIGIESQGDPNTKLESRLEELVVKYNCDIIFCACRTRGNTIISLRRIAAKYGYNHIKSSPYQNNEKSLHPILNDSKAKHLIKLLKSLKLI